MSFDLNIPNSDGKSLSLALKSGEQLFIVGANGTGKSSLMHRLYTLFPSQARLVTAHRQNWFRSSELTLTSQQKRQAEGYISNADRQPEARWKDDYSAQRAGIALYELVDAENVRAREITVAVDQGDVVNAKNLSEKSAPLAKINDLLAAAGIPIKIVIRANEEVRAVRAGNAEYGVSELSDGERNALLVAANVLTAKSQALILIDEPERHLHRSIISPFLTSLFGARLDCSFVISTHEVLLPLDTPSASVLLLRSCSFNQHAAVSWDADLLAPYSGLSEEIRRDILGARRKILFIEGNSGSLDKPLYALLFPSISVIPRGGCREVQQSVVGIREARDLHWLQAYGIVDGDRRSAADVASLEANGIYALPMYSVESIYYHPLIQRHLSERHVKVVGGDVNTIIATTNKATIDAVSRSADHLAQRVAEKIIRERFFEKLPTARNISSGAAITLSVDTNAIVTEERKRVIDLIASSDVPSLIEKYPIRETPALDAIAYTLGFQSDKQYEGGVIKMLLEDSTVFGQVRALFGKLADAMVKT